MPSISFVAAATAKSPSGDYTNTTFTVSKPSGIVAGDLMIAYLAFYGGPSASQRTVTAPSGWTKVSEEYVTASGHAHQMCVMTRTATASEPGSWNGAVSTNAYVYTTVTVAYRNAVGIATHGKTKVGASRNYGTATVSNPTATNWRIVMASYTSSSTSWEIDSNETTERSIDQQVSNEQDVQVGVWDSSGTVAVGNTSRSVTRDSNWSTSTSWIGIIDANDATVDGSLALSMPLPTVSAEMTQSYGGVLASSLPLPTMSMEGIASPPSGTLDVLVIPSVSMDAAHHASGALDVVVTPSMGVVAETRQFGIRVTTPEAESRVVTPRLGAAD